MKILLVPYGGLYTTSDEDIRRADLILKENELGDFSCLKWKDGNPDDVKTKVSE